MLARFNPEVLWALVELQGRYPVFHINGDDTYWGVSEPNDFNSSATRLRGERLRTYLLSGLNGSWTGYIWYPLGQELRQGRLLPPQGTQRAFLGASSTA